MIRGHLKKAALLLAALSVSSWTESAPSDKDDRLAVLLVRLDRPTLHVLGVQALIDGDDNRNAFITTRTRPAGTRRWTAGPNLFRVFHETVTGRPSSPQFSGSIFDLEPNTAYEIELHAFDPDGFDQVFTLDAVTRSIPRPDPLEPRHISVATAEELQAAFDAGVPGDVITIEPGDYHGSWTLPGSGTPQNPIVVRGASRDVVLDGDNCAECNILTVVGSYVHVENLTLTNAIQGLRFLGPGATRNVARRMTINNVIHGIRSTVTQTDFYLCDNVIEGRLVWPWVEDRNWTAHWDDRGIDVAGDGNVACHNRISGFGDPLVQKGQGSRAFDFYGNDIDGGADGVELDGAEGNARFFLNRVTNSFAAVSIQPIYGGPAYVLRNVVNNVFWTPQRTGEQVKLHPGGGNMPSGVLVLHNTFVSAGLAMNQQTSATQHNMLVANNLFVGPRRLGTSGSTILWTARLNGVRFDYNGYFPDGTILLGRGDGQPMRARNFFDLQRGRQFEQNGVLLRSPIFTSGLLGPVDPRVPVSGADVVLHPRSGAIDRGMGITGINLRHKGSAPDLGALETGCPIPHYGPRPAGQEHVVARIDC